VPEVIGFKKSTFDPVRYLQADSDTSTTEIDPDDSLTDALLRLQREISAMHRALGQNMRQLERLHDLLGTVVMHVREHDAAIGEPIGPFTSVDDLMAHLGRP
jgi:hypothetical protein